MNKKLVRWHVSPHVDVADLINGIKAKTYESSFGSQVFDTEQEAMEYATLMGIKYRCASVREVTPGDAEYFRSTPERIEYLRRNK